jgi:hypothetical protein
VRVGPALRHGARLADDADHGEEHEREREGCGERIATQHEADGVLPGWPVGRLQDEQDRDADDEREHDRPGEHRDAHPEWVDEVGHGHECQEQRADVGDDHPNEQHDPHDGPERDGRQEDLPVLADLPEQEHARPAERDRQDPAGEPAEHAEDRCKDRHATILDERSHTACATRWLSAYRQRCGRGLVKA